MCFIELIEHIAIIIIIYTTFTDYRSCMVN